MDNITIVIPVKDEEAGLQYLIEDFKDSKVSKNYSVNFVFVIDERTSDDSRKFASELSDHIIDQKGSTGKGDAIRKAVEILDLDQTKFVVFLDADGSYSFASVAIVLNSLENGSDVSSGSRFINSKNKPKGMSNLHKFGNNLLSKISTIKNRRKITDLCTGLWGFTSESIGKLEIKSTGFDLEAEIAGLITRKNLRHVEVGVEWSQRKGGDSKLKSFRDGFIILLRILRT